MATTNLQSMSVHVYQTGVGKRTSGDQGTLHLIKCEDGNLKLIVGRGKGTGWYANKLMNGWALMTPAEAHELAMALLHATHQEVPCVGDGILVKDLTHTYNLSVGMTIKVDLCTLIAKSEDVKKEILARVEQELKAIKVPKKEDLDAIAG